MNGSVPPLKKKRPHPYLRLREKKAAENHSEQQTGPAGAHAVQRTCPGGAREGDVVDGVGYVPGQKVRAALNVRRSTDGVAA